MANEYLNRTPIGGGIVAKICDFEASKDGVYVSYSAKKVLVSVTIFIMSTICCNLSGVNS